MNIIRSAPGQSRDWTDQDHVGRFNLPLQRRAAISQWVLNELRIIWTEEDEDQPDHHWNRAVHWWADWHRGTVFYSLCWQHDYFVSRNRDRLDHWQRLEVNSEYFERIAGIGR